MTLRNERVRKELMRDISEILRKEIRGLLGVVSIVDVEVSHDNSFAKVIYSVLGSEEQIEKTKEAIEKSTPKIRYEVGKRIRLRLTPELKFVYTDSLEKGSKVKAMPFSSKAFTRLKKASSSSSSDKEASFNSTSSSLIGYLPPSYKIPPRS